MRIFGMGLPEIIIIVVIICVLFGPMLFKKLNKQVKATSKAAKEGIEGGAKAAGVEVDMSAKSSKSPLERLESFQDRVDKMLSDGEEEEPEAKKEASE